MNLSILFSRNTASVALHLLLFVSVVSATGILKVQHKFASQEHSLQALIAHDSYRHSRILSAIDIPLGGSGLPSDDGLYYTKLGIGTPPKDYYVHVDTGSDILWVKCIECSNCPKKSDLGMKLSLYDLKESTTAKQVTCDTEFCANVYKDELSCKSNDSCAYRVTYGDGSTTDGYFVQDYLQYNQASGDLKTFANASIIFGCGTKPSDDLVSTNEALDGIFGFGQSNTSVISQLASAGKAKRIFSHCLEGAQGGGIFAIGEVVEPKVKTTPLLPNANHYNVNLKSVMVDEEMLDLPSGIFDVGDVKGTIIDSGTTLGYLPRAVNERLTNMILSYQPNMTVKLVDDQYQCFQYSNGSVDDGFPTITFHFQGSLDLAIQPHDYMFETRKEKDQWCIGWLSSPTHSDDMILLGDMALYNKLVVYDLENQVIGWTDYNCSSTIKLQDENSGAPNVVGAHDISFSTRSLDMGRVLILFLLSIIFQYSFSELLNQSSH